MKKNLWTGDLKALIAFARTDPPTKENLGMNAAMRLVKAVIARGVREDCPAGVKDGKALDGRTIKIYPYFQDSIFGKEEEIDEVMNVIKIAASDSEIGRNLFVLVGAAGTAKSTIAQKLRESLEGTMGLRIKGCPHHENPLKFIPHLEREKLCAELGIRTPPGDICPWCDKRYGKLENWEDLPVTEFVFCERKGDGIAVIGTAQNQQDVDISGLIGGQAISRLANKLESDPDAWDTKKGALFRAGSGILEIVEIFKLEAKFHNVFSTICQEGRLDIEGIGSVTGLDTFIIGHTNPDEFNTFLTRKGGEWQRRRTTPIHVRHVLSRACEEQVQRKLVGLTTYKKVHASPYTYELLAHLGILSRLTKSEKVKPFQKMCLYAGIPFDGQEDLDISVEDLYKEGKNNKNNVKEGTIGLDSTNLSKMILFALNRAEENGCLFVLDLVDEIAHYLENDLDSTIKDRSAELNAEIKQMLSDIKDLYRQKCYKDAVKCFLSEHQQKLENMFRLYILYCNNFVDSVKLATDVAKKEEYEMRRIESRMDIQESGKREWRTVITRAVLKSESKLLKDFPKANKAIEAIMIKELEPLMRLTLKSDKISEKDEQDKNRNLLLQQLIVMGYCAKCAQRAIEVAADTMQKE